MPLERYEEQAKRVLDAGGRKVDDIKSVARKISVGSHARVGPIALSELI